MQIINTEHLTVKHIAEVRERKLWSGEKVSIPAGSAKLLKVRIEGDWRGEGFHQAVHKLYMYIFRNMYRPEIMEDIDEMQ